MDSPSGSLYSISAGLARASARVEDVVRALDQRRRVDLAGVPAGAAAMLLAQRASVERPVLVVTADAESARRTAADLAFFTREASDGDDEAFREVLHYPASDVTPYLEVAPDRRAAMDRLAVLFHVAQRLPWRFLVAPVAALARRVPPRDAIRQRSVVVRAEEELDRDELLRILGEGGYMRVPVAEDPGTFAVRGSIIDVYPPHAEYPARIELDDWLVTQIKLFDPDDQRTVRDAGEVPIHPVRDTMLGPGDVARARERVRHLCDEVNLPTSKTRQILDDLASGRQFYGIDGFLPAFHEELESLFDYVGGDAPVWVLDPTAVAREVSDELERARGDFGARREEGAPTYPIDAHYLDELAVADRLKERSLAVVHRLAVAGAPEEDESPLAFLESVAPDDVMNLGGEDQAPLAAELEARRKSRQDTLTPLADRARAWLDAGLRVSFTARTRAQADRLLTLLRGSDVPVDAKIADRAPDPGSAQQGRATVVVGALCSGFVLATGGVSFVTEEEIFGARAHRRRESKRRRDKARAFVEDLRQLAVGDYVVHVDHGIGRYLGLERKKLGESQYERMLGKSASSVEVLVVEYAGGDRLFLPVTRLNQIEKYAGKEGASPKLDRLGGSTFSKTKARVRKQVQKLADELLRLYAERAATERAPLPDAGRDYAEFEATFPFEETRDQAKAIEDVLGDLDDRHPMDRVVCGDVGFGKTEVALRAAFRVAMSGRQVALLCPTTVLAQQHVLTFQERLRDYPVKVEALSRFVEKKDQARIVAGLKDGTVDVVVGTHRLLSKDVHFKNLGLLVVDEEQRFGVTHKERIKQLRTHVDVLTLSATPIPRTLQMAIGGLRDLSLIATPPIDRRAVRTFVSRWDDHVVSEAIRRELARGGQVFFVYNRIEGLYERADRVQGLVPEARVAVAHGQMKPESLEQIMTDFVDGRYDVLCSTAIIESGLDIPRANTIVIDRADMFGLAQLYQLRGRVGRSRERAYCYLITPPPSQMTDEARYRIEALERFTELGSGFQVASLDMELRGAGDLLGAEQSGSVAAVGFDLFLHMLEEAVAQLRGEPLAHDIDPELTLDVEHFIPDDYVEDVGLRLSIYKRAAQVEDDQELTDLAAELEDRFGPPPAPALALIRAMRLKPALRDVRALGCEAFRDRVTLHLREDTPLDPARVLTQVQRDPAHWSLSPDMKLTRRFDRSGDGIENAEELLRELARMRKPDA